MPAGEQPNMSHTPLEISERMLDKGGVDIIPKIRGLILNVEE